MDNEEELNRDDALRSYLSTKYLTSTPPESVLQADRGPKVEATPGDAQGEQVKESDPYAEAANSSELKAARERQDNKDVIAAIGRAVQGFVTANGQAYGYKPDDSAFSGLEKSGERGVANAEMDRQNRIKAYLQQREMERQGVQDKYAANAEQRAQGEYERKPIEAQKERDFRDKELNQRITAHHEDVAEQGKNRANAAAIAAQAHKDALVARQAEKDAAATAKTEKDQKESYTHLRHDLESFRGNGAAQQAAKDVLSADKALQMVRNRDPNTLTTQDLSLLAGEMAKIATGGVPTEHGQQSLMPSNLATKAAELQNFLSSNPTNAQAGEYVKKNLHYLEDMKNIAADTVADYRRNVAKGYRERVSPENYNEALRDYDIQEREPDVDAYAKKHGISYQQAAQVKAARGGQ